MTLHEHVTRARERLRVAGIEPGEARLDAELLARHALRWDRVRFVVHRHERPPNGFARAYEQLIIRRARREPAALILGLREFWGLDFEVSSDTLIPRPETEIVVERVLAAFRDRRPPASIVDVGTGTGCLAVALAREFEEATVIGTDLSDAAIAMARRNARRHGVDDRVSFRRADVLDGIDGRPDLVVSNPPYVPAADGPALPPEVREFEPPGALFAGRDGLRVIRALVRQAGQRLRSHGMLAFEIGADQREATAEILRRERRLSAPTFHRDLQGIPRVAVATRRPDTRRSANG